MRCGLFKLALPSLGVLATIGTLTLGTMVACDSTARIFLRLVQLDRVQVIGTTPVKQTTRPDGSVVWTPACNGGAEALRLDFNLQSTIEGDNDLQIRPGQDAVGTSIVDIREGGNPLAESNFDLKLECLQAADGTASGAACTGKPNPNNAVVDKGLGYTDHVAGQGRGASVGVAILIDQSASILGTVDKDTCLEGKEGAFDQIDNIDNCQSDHAGLRLTAAQNVLGTLNPGDPAIVFQFYEGHCDVVCDLGPDFPDTQDQKLQRCYSTNRELVMPSDKAGPINLLQGTAKGRSNLWACIDFVHQFLQQRGEVTRHVLVLTDGPDTCSSDSEDFQHCFTNDGDTTIGSQAQEQCGGSRSFEQAKKTWTDYQDTLATNGRENDLHLSFIQFQSKGYPDMDARMQQAACQTGGHYIFLNFNTISKEFTAERRDALIEATTRIRNAFGGFWTLVSDVPSFTGDPSKDVANVARGLSYSIAGTLQMTAPKIKETIPAAHFAWGGVTSITPPALPNTDSRVASLKPCVSDADCPGAGSACGVRCNTSTGVCRAPADGETCPGGICCDGGCAAGLTICDGTNKGTFGNPGACP